MKGPQPIQFTGDPPNHQTHIGPRNGIPPTNVAYESAPTIYKFLGFVQFALIVFAAVAGSLGLTDFINANNSHCSIESCANGEPGPQGDNGTCIGQCINGTDGKNGTDGFNYTRYPNFGQWNYNAITNSSPYLPGFDLDSGLAGTWIPILDPSSGSNGFFTTDNSDIFSSSGTGFDVIYNGPNNGWLTVYLYLQVFRQVPYFSDISFYEVNWEDPNTAPFVASEPKIDKAIETDGIFQWWSIASTVKMKLPTGAVLKAYSIFPTQSHISYTVKNFNLLVVLD